MSKDKIIGMPDRYNELSAAAADLRGNLPAMLEYTKLIAEIKWKAYQTLIDLGFNEDQALELSKDPLKL